MLWNSLAAVSIYQKNPSVIQDQFGFGQPTADSLIWHLSCFCRRTGRPEHVSWKWWLDWLKKYTGGRSIRWEDWERRKKEKSYPIFCPWQLVWGSFHSLRQKAKAEKQVWGKMVSSALQILSVKCLAHWSRVIWQSVRYAGLTPRRICAVNEQWDPALRGKGKRATDNLHYDNHSANELCNFSGPDVSQVAMFTGRIWDTRPICNCTIYWLWLKINFVRNKICNLWKLLRVLGQFDSFLHNLNSTPSETFSLGGTG